MVFICMKSPFQQLDLLETNSTYPVMRYKLIWLRTPYLETFLGRRLKTPLLTPTALVPPAEKGTEAAGFTPTCPKELLVRVSRHPSPNEGPETISRWGLPWAWSCMVHPSWTQGTSGCCVCLGEKKSSKGTRQVTHFPSHTEERSGGSPCWSRLLCSLLFIVTGAWAEQTLESSQPWRDDSA